jgi:hypothetical protein
MDNTKQSLIAKVIDRFIDPSLDEQAHDFATHMAPHERSRTL